MQLPQHLQIFLGPSTPTHQKKAENCELFLLTGKLLWSIFMLYW